MKSRIKTAWSSSSKINLKNINSTMDIYENIQGRMRKNGFHLLKDKLVQSTKPHWLWIIWEVFWKVLGNFFIFFIVIVNWSWELFESRWDLSTESGISWIVFIIIWIIFLLFIILIFVFSYLDLKRRKYDIYTDSIFYTEWFLTKHFSFLPMESVSDTENTQSFFSKVFGLHDVVVSSEWSNNSVSFKNMLDWEQMMKNIKYLKDNIIMWEKDILKWENKTVNSLIGFKDKIEKPLDYDKNFKVEYKMNMLKAILVTLPLLFIPPAFIVVLIGQFIKVKFTTFLVEESSIEKKFEFFSKKYNSFSVEKITGIVIRESLLDKLLWTCSISFWSIGASSSIKFSDIKKTPDLEKNLLAKIWIKIEEDRKQLKIDFSFMNYLKASLGFSIFFGILFIVAIVNSLFVSELNILFVLLWLLPFILLFALVYLYKVFYYNKSRYIQNISDNFLESISWIFFITKYYVLYRNIKWIKSIKYPLTNTWTFIFNVAWEQIASTKWQKWFSILSNNVKIPYLSNIFDAHTYYDNILNESKIDQNLIASAKQDIWNSIFLFVIIAIILALVWLQIDILLFEWVLILFSIIIWLIVWGIKVKYYNFEKDRVMFGSWIIYKRRHSILYQKFNFIEKNQWFINKIFKNWMIKIYTLWSWQVEMLIKDIHNFKDIYKLLKK